MNPFDRELHDRTEEIFTVPKASSLNNLYANIELPQNPGLAPNNWNSAHQDSYCSESVGLSGPTTRKIKMIKQLNPYGFTPVMVCNSNDQMIGVSLATAEQQYRLVVFDRNCRILSATETSTVVPGTFGGGYFFLNNADDTIVIANNGLTCYPTADVAEKDDVYPLDPIWDSTHVVSRIFHYINRNSNDFDEDQHPIISKKQNSLYSALPVWGQPNRYWCLVAGKFESEQGSAPVCGVVPSPAAMAVVEISPDPGARNGCRTKVLDALPLDDQWNNNTFAVDEDGAYFVTNALNQQGVCNEGYMYAVSFENGRLSTRWRYAYQNSGYMKPGQTNVGSGTTPTLTNTSDGRRLAAITDNAYPQLNVVVVDRNNGQEVSTTPVFPKMRGCDEASLIGVGDRFVVENNFGHIFEFPRSQYVANEPGMAMLQTGDQDAEIIWENQKTCFFAMNMLARQSGIIFAHTCDWSDDISATKGGMYFMNAIDSWDGRIIWRIPMGRGRQNCHEYGGIYFNHRNEMYIGSNRYLFAFQEIGEDEQS